MADFKTLKELSIEFAKKQPEQVDDLTEEAPILGRFKFQVASHAMWNIAEKVTEVTGPAFVDMNAPLGTVDAATKLQKVDLSILGGQMTVPEDTAKVFGGREKYFARKMPSIMKQSGMTTERAILYDNMRQWAIDNNKIRKTAAGSGAGYTILAVRIEEGANCGLYSPEGFSGGAILDRMHINGGNLYDIGSGVLGYGIRLKSYLGWQIVSDRNISAILNVQSGNLPTAMQIDDALADIRATNSGSTMLLMHERVKNYLTGNYKDGVMKMVPGDKNIDRFVDSWNGVPIVTSYNFYDGTEAFV